MLVSWMHMGCAADVGADPTSIADEAVKHGGGNGGPKWDPAEWDLQLPTGSKDHPDIITALSGYKGTYFYVDTDGGLTFVDPSRGWTTHGSAHPRTELRELATWPATGTNTLSADAEVVKVPKKVTIAQIFQAPNAPSKPLCELEYESSGDVQLLLERDNQGSAGAGGGLHPVGSAPKGKPFHYEVSLTKNVIQIVIEGKTSKFDLPPTFKGESFYFKAGAYDQSAKEGAPSNDAATVVKLYSLTTSHTK